MSAATLSIGSSRVSRSCSSSTLPRQVAGGICKTLLPHLSQISQPSRPPTFRVTLVMVSFNPWSQANAAELATTSFLTVAIVNAAHCALLCLQYGMSNIQFACDLPAETTVAVLGHKCKRRTAAPLWSLGSLAASFLLFIASAAIPTHSSAYAKAKVALLYVAIVFEFAMIGVQSLFGSQVPARKGHLLNEYGCLSITIL